MNREQMVEKAVRALGATEYSGYTPVGTHVRWMENAARDILNAILPQITTLAELEALPHNVVVMAPRSGVCMRQWEVVENGWPGSPALTVVWQPEVTA